MAKKTTNFTQGEKLSIKDQPRLDLSVDDRRAIVEALNNPQPVNDRLRDTVRRYRLATGV